MTKYQLIYKSPKGNYTVREVRVTPHIDFDDRELIYDYIYGEFLNTDNVNCYHTTTSDEYDVFPGFIQIIGIDNNNNWFIDCTNN